MRVSARFFDGSSLEAKDIHVVFSGGRVDLFDTQDVCFSDYTNDDFILRYADKYGDRIDLGVVGEKDIRIIFEATGIRSLVGGFLPQVEGAVHGDDWKAATIVSAGLVGIILVLGILVWQLERIVPALVPDDTARNFGAGLADGYVELLGGRCSSGAGEEALQKMVARLTKNNTELDLRVQVVNHELSNAFAMPGGQVVLFDGLIQEASSAEEVAGVLAHEIGHEKYKHAMRGITRSIGIDIFGSIFAGSEVTEISKQLIILGHSRSMETEADQIAIKILQSAEISPIPLAGFFDRVSEAESNVVDIDLAKVASFFSTHPESHVRAETMRNAGGTTVRPVLSKAEWQAMKSMCDTSKPR